MQLNDKWRYMSKEDDMGLSYGTKTMNVSKKTYKEVSQLVLDHEGRKVADNNLRIKRPMMTK
jgi:hypothetical protein